MSLTNDAENRGAEGDVEDLVERLHVVALEQLVLEGACEAVKAAM